MIDFDAALDLRLERTVDVPVAAVWRCWTEPHLLEQWFCPKPWRVEDVVLELRPGGAFNTTMLGPDGERSPMRGCVLHVEPERRLVFTDALTAGWRPSAEPFFTGIVTLAPDGDGTHYVAIARHASAETRQRHSDMGFEDGWGAALDQLLALARTL